MARERYVKWAASLIVVLLAAVLLEPLPNQASEVTVFGPRVYTRDTGKPRVEIDTFTVAIPDGDYTLAVQNGDSPATRVTSAVIFFNGRQLFAPDDFKKQVPLLTVGVALAEENEIRVELRSKPGSFLVISIAGTPHNTPPEADAGPDQIVAIGDLVTLDGSGSGDADGDSLTFLWELTPPPGSNATLSDPTAEMPTFSVDLPGSYSAELVVNDGTDDSAPGTVTITTENTPPVADAGPDQTVALGGTVALDGSGSSDADGDPLTFDWLLTPPAESSSTLSDPTAVMPTFDVDLPGSYSAELVVNDGTVDSAPDTVTITTENSPPVAGAGPDQTVLVGDTVSLDGSASHDADGDPLTFAWRLTPPAGSSATLSDPTAVMPTFAVDLPGTYSAELVVDDGTVGSAPDTVTISTENSRPVADAGPDQTATVGDTVTLDGSGSFDVDLDPLLYAWSFTFQPPGSTAGLTDADRELASFVPDLAGLYVAQLIVGDGLLFGTPDTATVDVAPLNHPPVITSTP
ncbi:MAG TPA: PKD domain-containing protein, partial [Acidimicrobiia bacterium]